MTSNALLNVWQTSLPSSGYDIVSTLVIEDRNRVYMGSKGRVYRLDFYTGVPLYTNELPDRGNYEVRFAAPADGSSLFVGINGWVVSLDPTTLQTIWQMSLKGCGYDIVSLIYASGTLYAGCNGYVYRLNPGNGEVTHTNGLSGCGNHEVRLATTFANDLLLVGIWGTCLGLSMSDLSTKWDRSLKGCGWDVTSVAGGNGCGYAACNGHVYRLDSKGVVVNENGLEDTGRYEVRLALNADGSRLFVGTNGYGISLNPSDLTTVYKLSLPGSGYTITDVVPGANTTFFANNGYVFQLDAKGAQLSKNPLLGFGKYETRLAASSNSDVRVFAGIDGWVTSLFALTPQPHNAWMSAFASTIGPKMLREVKIPGTHDSGTYAITARSKVGKDMPDWLKYIQDLGLPVGVVWVILALWSVSQTLDFRGQLDAGIRYLDLRVQSDFGAFSFVHGLVGSPVTDLLDQLGAFLDAPGNDKEVVILDFNHFYGMSPEDHQSLANMLHAKFGDKLAPASLGADVTLNMLWSTSHRIIITYDDKATVNANPKFLWPQSNIESPWPDVQDKDVLYNKLSKEYLPNKRNKLFVLQGLLTPDGGMISRGIALPTVYPDSLLKAGLWTTTYLTYWLAQWGNQGVNIVICDWFNCTESYVNMVLQMNSESPVNLMKAQTLGEGPERPDSFLATSDVDPEKVRQDIANGTIDVAQIAASAVAEYRLRFGSDGHSDEVAAILKEVDRVSATASPQDKVLLEKPAVVEDPSKLIPKEDPKDKQI